MRKVLYLACNELYNRLYENIQRRTTKSSSEKLYKEEGDLKGCFLIF